MKIHSRDGTLEIIRGDFDDPADVDVAVDSGGSSARVTNIFPLSAGEFFQQVRAIEQANEGRAVLAGTEGFQLVVELPGGNGAFWVEVRMSAGFGGGGPARTLRCRLHVDGEYWSSMIAGLHRELLGRAPVAPVRAVD